MHTCTAGHAGNGLPAKTCLSAERESERARERESERARERESRWRIAPRIALCLLLSRMAGSCHTFQAASPAWTGCCTLVILTLPLPPHVAATEARVCSCWAPGAQLRVPRMACPRTVGRNSRSLPIPPESLGRVGVRMGARSLRGVRFAEFRGDRGTASEAVVEAALFPCTGYPAAPCAMCFNSFSASPQSAYFSYFGKVCGTT